VDSAKLNITGQEMAKILLDTEPRIVLASGNGIAAAQHTELGFGVPSR